jgi:S-adenosylmethionine-diacylgycerolhomoserine-N-methlytransferase
MIPAWEQAVESALALLAPGGQLHIVDFGGQEDLPGWFRTLLRRWLTHFDVTPRDMMEAHLRRCAARHGLHLTMMRPFLGYAQHAILTDFGSEKKTAASGMSEAAA